MSEVQVLEAEAKRLLTDFQGRVKDTAGNLGVDVEDILVKIDHTQLRVAVHRLGLFVDHVERVITDFNTPASPAADSEPEPDDQGSVDGTLDDLKRDELNKRASAAGVDSPDRLPNKQAVIDAITEAEGK